MSKTLAKELRKKLEKITLSARTAAEKAAESSLQFLAVHEAKPRPHMDPSQRAMRNRLRARGKSLGDVRDSNSNIQELTRLIELVAYENWHRLLFARFLAENHLLRTDEANGFVPVSLQDCEDLAPELGAKDGWELACRFARNILPGVFRAEDPALEIKLAPN